MYSNFSVLFCLEFAIFKQSVYLLYVCMFHYNAMCMPVISCSFPSTDTPMIVLLLALLTRSAMSMVIPVSTDTPTVEMAGTVTQGADATTQGPVSDKDTAITVHQTTTTTQLAFELVQRDLPQVAWSLNFLQQNINEEFQDMVSTNNISNFKTTNLF